MGAVPEDYTLETAERTAILRALRAAEWNKTRAARMLGIGRTSINRKINLYALRRPQPGALCGPGSICAELSLGSALQRCSEASDTSTS
jgi:hypothetical protein